MQALGLCLRTQKGLITFRPHVSLVAQWDLESLAPNLAVGYH